MITVEYEGMYISDKEYIAILTHKNYPRHRRKVRLMLPQLSIHTHYQEDSK